MKRKLIAFDLDGTLTDSKSPVTDTMATLLTRLLDKYIVLVMSGGKFEQFEKQLMRHLKAKPEQLANLHILPTCGTRYYRFNSKTNSWQQIYAEDFSDEEKAKIIKALNDGIDKFGYREKKTWGDIIDDRGSQITFSALGQDIVEQLGQEGVRLKEEWDPDGTKKHQLRDYIAGLIPEFEVRVGGGTSVDITKRGIDKAYGMQKLLDRLKIEKQDVLFVGDRLEEGGNDYPIKLMGIECIATHNWQAAAKVIKDLLEAN